MSDEDEAWADPPASTMKGSHPVTVPQDSSRILHLFSLTDFGHGASWRKWVQPNNGEIAYISTHQVSAMAAETSRSNSGAQHHHRRRQQK